MVDILYKQECFKRLVINPDFQMLVHEMNVIAKGAVRKQLDCNPFTEATEIAKYKMLRTVLTITIPDRIESFINYQADAPDKLVVPKKQWKFIEYWNQLKTMF